MTNEIYILIADDEEILRKGLASLPWDKLSIKLLPIAQNGLEAIEISNKHRIDILLTDINMPVISGMELAEHIRKKNSQARILFLTGYSEFEYAKKAIELMACDYILKPSNPTEILNAVEKAKNSIIEEQKKLENHHQLELQLENFKKITTKDLNQNISNKADISHILCYIAENYKEQLNLNLLAERFHFSSVYLSRFIKKETGYTFKELLINTRMYHAAYLLKNTNLKNAEIAWQIGMNDERYFGQVFQKIFGMSPIEYRKNKKDLFNLKEMLFGDLNE